MAKRIFLIVIACLLFPFQSIEAKDSTALVNSSFVNQPLELSVDEVEAENMVPAKEAHAQSEKGVNIILIIIFILAAIGLMAVAVVIVKGKK